MDESIRKPVKSNGTRWVTYKDRACKALLQSYPCIVTQIENEVGSASTLPADKAKLVGYLKVLKSVTFVANLLFFKDILSPLSLLSLSLQKQSVSFTSMMSSLQSFYNNIDKLKKLCVVPEPEEHESNHEDVIDVEPLPKKPAMEGYQGLMVQLQHQVLIK